MLNLDCCNKTRSWNFGLERSIERIRTSHKLRGGEGGHFLVHQRSTSRGI